MKSYSELCTIDSFEDRLAYLKLDARVGDETFGHMRYVNQDFYRSKEWKQTRVRIIARDFGREVAMDDEDYEIDGVIIIHHIVPITLEDILNNNPLVFDPDNLVCVSKRVHDYIHYGKRLYIPQLVTRARNDQAPWLS